MYKTPPATLKGQFYSTLIRDQAQSTASHAGQGLGPASRRILRARRKTDSILRNALLALRGAEATRLFKLICIFAPLPRTMPILCKPNRRQSRPTLRIDTHNIL
jgi:hypothetical protein